MQSLDKLMSRGKPNEKLMNRRKTNFILFLFRIHSDFIQIYVSFMRLFKLT